MTAVGDPEDMFSVVDRVQRHFPRAALFGVGYSAGGAILSTFMGACGPQANPIQAACLVSPGYDMEHAFDKMPGIYQKLITMSLSRIVHRGAEHLQPKGVHLMQALRAHTLRDFHRVVYSPLYNDTPDSLIERHNPMGAVDAIRVPVVCVSASDDPVCLPELIPVDRVTSTGHGAIVLTRFGSHTRFIRGIGETSWAVEFIVEYFEGCRDVLLGARDGAGASQPQPTATPTKPAARRGRPPSATKAAGSSTKSTLKRPSKRSLSAKSSASRSRK